MNSKISLGICIRDCEVINRTLNKRRSLRQGDLLQILEGGGDNGDTTDTIYVQVYNSDQNSFEGARFECVKANTCYIVETLLHHKKNANRQFRQLGHEHLNSTEDNGPEQEIYEPKPPEAYYENRTEKMEKFISKLQQKLNEVQRQNCNLAKQATNHDYLLAAQKELIQLAKEYEALRQQFEYDTCDDPPCILDMAKQREIDDLIKNIIIDLRDRIMCLESGRCCNAEIKCFQKVSEELNWARKSLAKERESMKIQNCVPYSRTNEEYEELQAKCRDLENRLKTEISKCKDIEMIREENAELKRCLAKLREQVAILQYEVCDKDKHIAEAQVVPRLKNNKLNKIQDAISEFQLKLNQVQYDNSSQFMNNAHHQISQADICQIFKENIELRQQLERFRNAPPCESDSSKQRELNELFKKIIDFISSENADLKINLKESRAKITALQQEIYSQENSKTQIVALGNENKM